MNTSPHSRSPLPTDGPFVVRASARPKAHHRLKPALLTQGSTPHSAPRAASGVSANGGSAGRACARALLGLFLAVNLARAADGVPPLINYQGRLTDDQGQPVASGGYRLAFRLWSDASSTASSNLVWGREFEVTVVNGAFNVILNDNAQPAEAGLTAELPGALSGSNRYLGLTVLRTPAGTVPQGEREEVTPRQQLLSTAYSMVAADLAQAAADLLVPPGSINAFGGAAVPPGWLLCDGRAQSSREYPRLFAAIGTAWGDGSNDEDPATDFSLPDLRGVFLRGVNGSRMDPTQVPLKMTDPQADARTNSLPGGNTGNAPGSLQLDGAPNIAGTATTEPNAVGFFRRSDGQVSGPFYRGEAVANAMGWEGLTGYRLGFDASRSSLKFGASPDEIRPKNAYVHFIIRH